MLDSKRFTLLLAALTLLILPTGDARAQNRGGSDPGRSRFLQGSDPRRFSPTVISPNSRLGPRADGVRVRVLTGPANNPPFDGNANGTFNNNTPTTQIGNAVSHATAEVLLPNGFRDAGRTLTPAAHLQRFPPPPNPPQFPATFTVSFPSRRDGILAPNLVRDQAGQAALRTSPNRLEERNAFQR